MSQMSIPSNVRPVRYVCPQDGCHKPYGTRSSVQRHRRVAHEGRVFLCENCGAQRTRPGNLEGHICRNSYRSSASDPMEISTSGSSPIGPHNMSIIESYPSSSPSGGPPRMRRAPTRYGSRRRRSSVPLSVPLTPVSSSPASSFDPYTASAPLRFYGRAELTASIAMAEESYANEHNAAVSNDDDDDDIFQIEGDDLYQNFRLAMADATHLDSDPFAQLSNYAVESNGPNSSSQAQILDADMHYVGDQVNLTHQDPNFMDYPFFSLN